MSNNLTRVPMTRYQHDHMVHEIVKGTMCELSKAQKINVIISCLTEINNEPEYPTRVPIDTDNLAEPF